MVLSSLEWLYPGVALSWMALSWSGSTLEFPKGLLEWLYLGWCQSLRGQGLSPQTTICELKQPYTSVMQWSYLGGVSYLGHHKPAQVCHTLHGLQSHPSPPDPPLVANISNMP